MMPTFPLPSLKFRTAGFPRYGLKAGISGEAFPVDRVCLRPSCRLPPPRIPAQCQGRWVSATPPCERISRSTPGALAPAGLCCPGHLRLTGPIRPTRRHISTSPLGGLYEMPSLYRITNRARQPASGSELSLMLFHNMSSSTTTGNSSVASTQCFTEDPSLQLRMTVSAFPSPSHSDPSQGVSFRGLTTVRLRYDLLFCLPSLSEQTRFASSHREGVYFRASDGLVTRAAAGYHYGANWAICTGGSCTR